MFKLFKKNKKGFTLVEVIVVLVILAILAAIMIPSMTGWIDKAKDQSILVKGRTALLAAQTIVSERYAGTALTTATWSSDTTVATDFAKLATDIPFDKVTVVITGAQITSLAYTDGTKTATYTYTAANGGSWVVS